MNLFGFFSLGSAWLFSLLVPVVLFYFLKLKRPRLQVPSLVLWQQVLRDSRVNSPFQRFKRNILLLLQLILLMLVVLAAMQPYFRAKAAAVQRLPVLIDCSASMAALDKPGGISRLEAAKEKVNKLVDGLLPDRQLCLISFSRSARKLTGFTNNKRILREALQRIEVEDLPGDIEDALRMTQALARGASFDEVLLLSDGNFPAQTNFELSFELNYQRLPPPGPNIGISSFNARRSTGGYWDVFVSLEGRADHENAAAVKLVKDGKIVATEDVSLTAGASERVIFRVPADKPATLKASVVPDGFDSLASDNVAFLNLLAIRPLSVYVPFSMSTYRHALEAVEGIYLSPQEGISESEASYDLVITDELTDLARQARTRFCVGLVPAGLEELVTVSREGSRVVDWRRNSPLLEHVELADLLIIDQPRSAEGVSEEDYENLGYEVLAYGNQGPLILQKREGEKLSFYPLFHTDRSTLPYRVGFPVLVMNLVNIAREQAGLAEIRAQHTGVLAPLVLLPGRTYRVEGPGGRMRRCQTGPLGILSGIPAPRMGTYVVSTEGAAPVRVHASLLSTRETNLNSVEEVRFKEDLSVAAASEAPKTDRPLWSLLAALALCVLLGEWWYFQRRPGGYVG